MVFDFGVSNIPMPVFMAVHLAGLAIGASFAYKAFNAGAQARAFAWAFTLYALAEVLYMGYHVGTTTFLLSHTLAEVCDLLAVVLAFVGIGQGVTQRRSASRASASR